MIYRIQKKQYDAYKRQRKTSRQSLGFLIFKASDGGYYRTDGTGMLAVKEMTEFNANFKKGIDNQISLI